CVHSDHRAWSHVRPHRSCLHREVSGHDAVATEPVVAPDAHGRFRTVSGGHKGEAGANGVPDGSVSRAALRVADGLDDPATSCFDAAETLLDVRHRRYSIQTGGRSAFMPRA